MSEPALYLIHTLENHRYLSGDPSLARRLPHSRHRLLSRLDILSCPTMYNIPSAASILTQPSVDPERELGFYNLLRVSASDLSAVLEVRSAYLLLKYEVRS